MDTTAKKMAETDNHDSNIKTDSFKDTGLEEIDIPEMIEKIKANFEIIKEIYKDEDVGKLRFLRGYY